MRYRCPKCGSLNLQKRCYVCAVRDREPIIDARQLAVARQKPPEEHKKPGRKGHANLVFERMKPGEWETALTLRRRCGYDVNICKALVNLYTAGRVERRTESRGHRNFHSYRKA